MGGGCFKGRAADRCCGAWASWHKARAVQLGEAVFSFVKIENFLEELHILQKKHQKKTFFLKTS